MILGYIALHRTLLEWEWYDDVPCKVLFIHCMLKANFKETRYRGKEIKRGQLVTGLSVLAQETGLSLKQVRTALKKLEDTGNISKDSGKHGTVITVCKYDDYQSPSDNRGKQKASKRQDSGKIEANEGQHNNKVINKEGNKGEEETTPAPPQSFDEKVKTITNDMYQIPTQQECEEYAYSIPTDQYWKDYAKFTGINFFDYYSNLGWKDKNGVCVLKNWRNKLSQWTQRDIRDGMSKNSPNPPQNRNAAKIDHVEKPKENLSERGGDFEPMNEEEKAAFEEGIDDILNTLK